MTESSEKEKENQEVLLTSNNPFGENQLKSF